MEESMQSAIEHDVTEEMVMEAMCPDLSQDEFTICDRLVKIKPVSLRIESEVSKLMAAAGREIQEEFQISGLAGANALAGNIETLAKLIVLFARNSNVTLTLDQVLDQSELDSQALMNIVLKYGLKIRNLEPVLDFFEKELWPLATKALKAEKERLVANATAQLADAQRALQTT